MTSQNYFSNLSIKNKLILVILSVSSIVLLLALVFITVNHSFSERRKLIHNITTNSHLLGEYCVVPLSFADDNEAQNVLSKVKSIPEILEIALYDAKGLLFSKVGNSEFSERLEVKISSDYYEKKSGIINFYHPINFQGQFYGTIHLVVTTKFLQLELLKEIAIMVTMFLVLVILTYLLAASFQKIISHPILALAKIFERGSQSSDYTQRVKWHGKDEIGTLYRGYNQFMEQLELRAKARLEAEEELRKSEQRYRAVVEDQIELICRYQPNGKLTFANSAFCKFFQIKENEIGRYNIAELMPNEIPLLNFLENKDKTFDILNVDCQMDDASHKPIWHNWSHRKIFDAYNQLLELQAIGMDISDRIQAEKEAKIKQEQLIQAGKMVTLGTLVSGVAHEINNPNGYIMLNSSLLINYGKLIKEKMKDLESREEFSEIGQEIGNFSTLAEKIKEGSDRINAIVKKLKDYYKKDVSGDKKLININEVIEKAIEILEPKIKSSTSNFNFYHTSSLPQINGNFQELEQVVINLLENSCQALKSPSDFITIRTGLAEGGKIKVEVHDSGQGIDKEHLKRIMDPFFTTKRNIGGTGLGLSLSLNIVADHNGQLHFESNPGEGTVATIILPVDIH